MHRYRNPVPTNVCPTIDLDPHLRFRLSPLIPSSTLDSSSIAKVATMVTVRERAQLTPQLGVSIGADPAVVVQVTLAAIAS